MITKTLLTSFTLASLALVGCSDDNDSAPAPAADTTDTLTLSFMGLEALGDDYVYEGWLSDGMGGVTSTGRFTVDSEGNPSQESFEIDEDIAAVAMTFILTIEPAVGDDPAPADTHVLAGDFSDDDASLTISHSAALGTDFSSAGGGFILATPSTASISNDEEQGVWFLDNSGSSPVGLNLPTLPDGWVYEGWVVLNGSPVTTGRFSDPNAADDDAGGATAGTDSTPPFPGQDFINPAQNLSGVTVVISVEPEPDDGTAPFAIKPLVGTAPNSASDGVQSLNLNAASFPTGLASWAPTGAG